MSPSTKRTSSGSCSMRQGATRLSAVLAGVSLAASGIQTSHTAMARCSFHPYTHPPMPAALSPVSFGVYGCMGHLACFLVFLVPHSTFCLQNGAVEGYSSSPALPRVEHFYQVAS